MWLASAKQLLIAVMVLAQNPALIRRQSSGIGSSRKGLAVQRIRPIAIRLMAIAALVPAIGACSSDIGLTNVTVPAKPETPARKPDWTTFSGSQSEFSLRPVTAADLVNAEGQCPDSAPGAVAAAPGEPILPATAPTVQGSIVLQMTECDVVRRAGLAEKVEIGADERGRRAAVLTFTRGPWPGVYRFAGGRLFSIERLAGPPPAAPRTAPGRKPTGT